MNYIAHEIKVLDNLIKNSFSSQFKALGITQSQGLIIKFIYESKEDVFQTSIENKFSVKRSTISESLSLMEKNKLIIREKTGRTNKIILTDKAFEILKKIEKNICSLENVIVKGLTASEIEETAKVLVKMKKNLEEVNIND